MIGPVLKRERDFGEFLKALWRRGRPAYLPFYEHLASPGFIARRTGASVQKARFGNVMLSGGYDVIFDCLGSSASMNESLKWTRSRGQVVFVATGHGGSIDLTPVWFTELNIVGAYGRQVEDFAGRRVGTYQLVHELMLNGKLDVARMLTHTFDLGEYRRAFSTAAAKARHKAIKLAFDFRRQEANGEHE